VPNARYTLLMAIELDDAFDRYQRADWLALAEKGMPEGQSLDNLTSATLDGRTVDALYTNRPAIGKAATPTTQSITTKSKLEGSVWDNRVVVWTCTPTLANNSILTALEGGASSIELHLGDHTGWSSSQLATALEGVYLDAAAISLRMPGINEASADALINLWNAAGIATGDAKGAFNFDPIGDHLKGLSNDTFSLEQSLRALNTLTQYTTHRYSEVPTVLVDGSCHHNAGATAVQELLATIATASIYLESLKSTSLDPTLISRQVQVQMSTDANTLMGVVKLRSLKMLWQQLLLALELPAAEPALVVETSKRHLSSLDPWVNHLRNTAAVSAAAFVNADTIIVHPHNVVEGQTLDDEELGLRVARNLPIILSEESHLNDVQDPFRGSFAVEHLCQDLCDAVWSALAQYKTGSAWFDTVQSGEWAKALHHSHKARCAELDAENQIMVGVNRYSLDKAQSSTSLKTDKPDLDRPSTLVMVRDAEHYEGRKS